MPYVSLEPDETDSNYIICNYIPWTPMRHDVMCNTSHILCVLMYIVQLLLFKKEFNTFESNQMVFICVHFCWDPQHLSKLGAHFALYRFLLIATVHKSQHYLYKLTRSYMVTINHMLLAFEQWKYPFGLGSWIY
jgi:hypothetical protein